MLDIADAPGPVTAGDRRFGMDEGHDGTRDEVPFLTARDRDDGLDVERVTHGVRAANPEIPIALERHADEVGDGVLKLFGQFRGRIRLGPGVRR